MLSRGTEAAVHDGLTGACDSATAAVKQSCSFKSLADISYVGRRRETATVDDRAQDYRFGPSDSAVPFPRHSRVDMDPQLLLKLSQRLRVVEGNVASAVASVQPAPSNFHPKGRVQVPHWVVAKEGTPGGQVLRGQSASPMCEELARPPASEIEQLRRELARAETQRDEAIAALSLAEQAADTWANQLQQEALQMRRLCCSMSDDEQVTQDEVSMLRARRISNDEAEDAAGYYGQLSQLNDDVRDLTTQLSELHEQRISLQTRVSSLDQEMKRQEADKIETYRSLDKTLLLHEASSSSCSTAIPKPDFARRALVPIGKADEDEEYDIEFSYDWGLEMSKKMPLRRIMQMVTAAAKLQADATSEEEVDVSDQPEAEIPATALLLQKGSGLHCGFFKRILI